ncbi:hypothetical protein [Pedobacter sp. JY14-1]|uniref:hypothetical protein n=1 Tax=Pedobacter sp. JY14-1 TaxID=3034151 RepID=UPI0023E22556|nr:hypothetical protein [Pedobacter sp. JY14-1]
MKLWLSGKALIYRFLFLLFLAAPLLGTAQSNYLKGYVITVSGETLQGYVDFKGTYQTAESLKFKKDEDAPAETYNLENCLGYGVDGKAYYERFTVNVSQAYTRTSNLRPGLDTSYRRQTVFLKVLQRGKPFTLFSYTDEIKERFYLQSSLDKEPVELFRAQYLTGTGYEVKGDYRFRTQLLNAMTANGVEDRYDITKLDVLRYDGSDLIKVVAAANGQRLPRETASRFAFFAGAGINVAELSYKGSHILSADDVRTKRSTELMLNAGCDLFLDAERKRIVLRAELAYFSSKNEIRKSEYIHSFDERTVSVMPQVIYHFYASRPLRIYAGLGGVVNYTNYRNNRVGRFFSATAAAPEMFESENTQLEPFTVSAVGRVGVLVSRRFELSANYIAPAEIRTFGGYSVLFARTTFGFSYFFKGYN